jgi:hydroxyacylglutathione hydrolase
VALNLRGAQHPGPVRELDAGGVAAFVKSGAAVLDVRPAEAFDEAHLAGAVNLPFDGPGLGTRAGWALGPEESIVLVCESLAEGCDAVALLYAAGVDNVTGVSVADVEDWRTAGLAVGRGLALTSRQLVPLLADGHVHLVDVRDRAEWRDGHIRGSLHLPLCGLGDGRSIVLPDGRPVAVACAGGRRAALAASVLRRRGQGDVCRVIGGITDLAGQGAPLVAGD